MRMVVTREARTRGRKKITRLNGLFDEGKKRLQSGGLLTIAQMLEDGNDLGKYEGKIAVAGHRGRHQKVVGGKHTLVHLPVEGVAVIGGGGQIDQGDGSLGQGRLNAAEHVQRLLVRRFRLSIVLGGHGVGRHIVVQARQTIIVRGKVRQIDGLDLAIEGQGALGKTKMAIIGSQIEAYGGVAHVVGGQAGQEPFGDGKGLFALIGATVKPQKFVVYLLLADLVAESDGFVAPIQQKLLGSDEIVPSKQRFQFVVDTRKVNGHQYMINSTAPTAMARLPNK